MLMISVECPPATLGLVLRVGASWKHAHHWAASPPLARQPHPLLITPIGLHAGTEQHLVIDVQSLRAVKTHDVFGGVGKKLHLCALSGTHDAIRPA